MTRRKVSFLQGTVPAPYKLPAEDHRLNHAGLWTPDNGAPRGPLGVRSGIVAGPGNPGQVSVVAGGVNVNPFQAVIQGTLNGSQGVYEVAADALEFRAITAASATEFRRGYVIARVYDQLNAGTGTVKDDWDVEVVYGPNAATAGAATLPQLPANSLILREFAVSNTGAITLVGKPTWTAPRTPALVVATEQAAKDLFAAVALPVGFTFYTQDTEAQGRVTSSGLLWFDTKWQPFTLRVSTTAGTGPYTEIVYGASVRFGQMYRKGREVSVRGYFQLGAGANIITTSLYHFGFPPGYAPKLPPAAGLGTNIAPMGNGRAVTTAGAGPIHLYHETVATAAYRWFLLLTAADQVISGGTTPAVINNTTSHFATFQGSYETDFEA